MGVTLVYSGKTVMYAPPREPTPYEKLCAAFAAGGEYALDCDIVSGRFRPCAPAHPLRDRRTPWPCADEGPCRAGLR